MAVNTGQINTFLFFKLPSAWWCGVRLKFMDETRAIASVKHRWANQNPFNSMFWAVQGMAAELATGAMVSHQIRESGKKISMLVQNNTANFSKKATGRITFTCEDGWTFNKRRFGQNNCNWRGANDMDAICRRKYRWSSGLNF